MSVYVYVKRTGNIPQMITEKTEKNLTKRNLSKARTKRKTNHFPLELDFALCASCMGGGGWVVLGVGVGGCF